MATIQWRPVVNALITPKSYRIQAVSRSTDGYDEMAADISVEQPIYSEETTVKGLAPLIMQWIQRRLINGSQVTLPDAFSFSVSFTGKLDSPDAPLPESDDLLQVNVCVSQPFVKEILCLRNVRVDPPQTNCQRNTADRFIVSSMVCCLII